MKLAEPILAEVRALVAERLGLAFPSRRGADLERALTDLSLVTLRAQPTTGPEWRELISRLTVGESYFFRDAAMYAALGERVLPALIDRRRVAGEKRLALWSAGCATGEEPYSLAMLLDRLLPDREEWTLTIFATDVDEAALAAAGAGRYTEWALRDTPAWVRGRHFRPAGRKQFELSRQIRDMVTFAPLNLATDPYPGSLDVIVCRNVLMYFTDAARARAVEWLSGALAADGWLLLSPLDATPGPASLVAVEAPGCRLLQRPAREQVPPRAEPSRPRPEPVAAPEPDTLARARAEADRGQLEAARALIHAALREQPLELDAHLLLAAVEEEHGDFEAAIAALRRAVYTAPDSSTAHFRLGGLLLRGGAAEAGRRSLDTAAALLGAEAPGTLVPGGDGLTAGRLLETARAHLEPAS